jgi:4-hydroxy-3-polyprenylbenzoate decarboxylase
MRHIVLAVTGASGACYATTLARQLARSSCKVHLIVSPMGRRLLKQECGIDEPAGLLGEPSALVQMHGYDDLDDVLASGSVATDGMVVCPASANTIAALAAGLCDNLITRAAFVHLKERRKLVLVPRETPTTSIDLENQARLASAGAIVLPASPGFYTQPSTIQDLVDFIVARILDALGVEHDMGQRYGTLEGPSS